MFFCFCIGLPSVSLSLFKMSRTERGRGGERSPCTSPQVEEDKQMITYKGGFSLPQFSKEFGPQLLVQLADIFNDILQFLSICLTQPVLSATALVGRFTVQQEVFSVIGFNFALTLLGFIYMLLKHLADVAMSRGVLQRLEAKRENVQQPSFFSSLCCCLQRGGGGGGGRVAPQAEADAGGETVTERLLHAPTNQHAAVSEEGGGGEDLEAGSGGGQAETDTETEDGEGDGGEDGEGEEGSALERRMETRVEKEGGILFWCLLFVSSSLHHTINETMDVLKDGLSVGSVVSSAALSAQPLLPASLIQLLAVRTGIPESFLSSVTAGTCTHVVLGISLYCYVGSLFARLCITDIGWMMWATSAYKRWGWGMLGVREL
uniref:Uncharacterized protein n=1 Tax=Chromera velia CCMP2878 TaxID=1169474 RepID=A0A0G4HS40_9ALVE|eukprot:Cvel_8238.t1-p1 / transcript=Cvel_8238.t1 / gene=Cvel_8238 / organism=Chromera_velia_CCMP2878 / gene_product=hypothetical protein / transcript_product=hypothetical protein / location=Cvel_scaffold450:35765-37534(+) / protein_length=375 / sequence_SO=supercontig / SO=protein_coding / is_pseudo=false